MIIVGSWDPFYHEYYDKLKRLILDNEVSDFITFKISASFEELIEIMKKSKSIFSFSRGRTLWNFYSRGNERRFDSRCT